MTTALQPSINRKIAYSCYFTNSREGEQFVPEHVFSYQLAGTLSMNDGRKESVFKEGDFRFIRRNQLIKFNKQPPPGGEFRSVSIYLDQEILRNFSMEYGYEAVPHNPIDTLLKLKPNALFKSFMDSLSPYQDERNLISEELQSLKQREAILVLLQADPALKNLLFDFSEPGKIDLEAFMNQNYHFNVQMNRFAYLTGRSLATFKRDFERIFQSSPGKWLQQRRLQEAYYLIKEKGKAPSDVYLDLGFEDLSHFSFVFKKQYGAAPSKI